MTFDCGTPLKSFLCVLMYVHIFTTLPLVARGGFWLTVALLGNIFIVFLCMFTFLLLFLLLPEEGCDL